MRGNEKEWEARREREVYLDLSKEVYFILGGYDRKFEEKRKGQNKL